MWLQDNGRNFKDLYDFVYCLLYKQVQSATAIITNMPLTVWHNQKVTLSENLLKIPYDMVQKNACLGFCEVQTS